MAPSNGVVSNGNSNGNGVANGHGSYVPSDDIQGRWEGVTRPYSKQQVSFVNQKGAAGTAKCPSRACFQAAYQSASTVQSLQ